MTFDTSQYDAAIAACQAAKARPDTLPCAICLRPDHTAEDCLHNSLAAMM